MALEMRERLRKYTCSRRWTRSRMARVLTVMDRPRTAGFDIDGAMVAAVDVGQED